MSGMRGGGMRGTRTAMVRGRGMRGARVTAFRTGPRRGFAVAGTGRRFAGRRYWRGGRWWYGPATVGFVGGGGGSCYWNCRNTGRGPGFCSTYAANFC